MINEVLESDGLVESPCAVRNVAATIAKVANSVRIAARLWLPLAENAALLSSRAKNFVVNAVPS
jgi:hypothetical protein